MVILAHGGAGAKKPSKNSLKALEAALKVGWEILKQGGCSLDAIIEAIAFLEDCGSFNAGAGGNLQLDGVRRLDAALMEGKGLNAGSVIGLEGIGNPIRAARVVMDLPHKVLTNVGAKRIAELKKLKPLGPPDERAVKRLEKVKKAGPEPVKLYEEYFSTVGAVALDSKGGLAAGSSTGGVAAMLPGRVGDTPMIGAGLYADNSGAVTCTGRGEDILRVVLAKEICMHMETGTPPTSVRRSFERLKKMDGQAGVLALNSKGRWAIMHTTGYMASGYADENGVKVGERSQ